MPRRARLPFNLEDRDYLAEPLADAVEAMEIVIEAPARRAAREPARTELPPRSPVPLSAIEEAWALNAVWLEPYLVRSIELAGGFRPILERAGLHSGERSPKRGAESER